MKDKAHDETDTILNALTKDQKEDLDAYQVDPKMFSVQYQNCNERTPPYFGTKLHFMAKRTAKKTGN